MNNSDFMKARYKYEETLGLSENMLQGELLIKLMEL